MGISQHRCGFIRKTMILLIVVLMFSCISTTAFASATPKISGANIKCKAGDTTEFPVSISNNPGIAAYFVYLTSESSSITFGSTVKRGDFCDSGTVLANTHAGNGIRVSWFDLKNANKSGELFSVDIIVAENTPDGIYPITVKISGENTINEDGDEVAFETVNGSVKVEGGKATVNTGGDTPVDNQRTDNQNADKQTDTNSGAKQTDSNNNKNTVGSNSSAKETGSNNNKSTVGSNSGAKQTGNNNDKNTVSNNDSVNQSDTGNNVNQADKKDGDKKTEEAGDAREDKAVETDTAVTSKHESTGESNAIDKPISKNNNSVWIIVACTIVVAAIVVLIDRIKSKK